MTRLEHILAMLKDDPNDAFLHYAEALERMKREEWDTAQAIFTKLIEQSPDYLGTYYQLGKLLEADQKFDAAIDVYTKGTVVAKKQGNRKILGELNEAILMLED